MKRKIIKQGHNTLTMTLPSKWAERFAINAGDEVELIEQGSDLRITTNKNTSQSDSVTIDISGLIIPIVWRLMSSPYRAGYDEIKIVFENKGFRDLYTAFTYNTIYALKGEEKELSPLEAIQAMVNRFIGFEIIEQKSNYCIIKDLGQTSPKEFDNTLRRIFLLIQTMSDAIMCATKGDKIELRGIHIMDTNLDRFQDFCLRILNKNGYKEFRKTPTMYTIVFILEMVGDEYKKVGIHMVKMKVISKNLKDFIIHVDNMLKVFYDCYYNFSDEKAEKVYKLDEEGYKIFEKIYPHVNNEEKELLHHMKKVGKFLVNLTELRIDLNY